MKFEFLGYQFKIVFYHGKSVLLGDHFGHDIGIIRKECTYASWCHSCKMQIGQVSKALRERKTYCYIRFAEIGKPVNGRDLWSPLFDGVGNPNEDEGDRFTKEIGRRASLANALRRENWFRIEQGEDVDREWPDGLQAMANLRGIFKETAWAAFNGRKK